MTEPTADGGEKGKTKSSREPKGGERRLLPDAAKPAPRLVKYWSNTGQILVKYAAKPAPRRGRRGTGTRERPNDAFCALCPARQRRRQAAQNAWLCFGNKKKNQSVSRLFTHPWLRV
jgi:hypothetical protein